MPLQFDSAYNKRKRALQQAMFACFRVLSYSIVLVLFIILGFILGSVASIFPGIPAWRELIVCIAAGLGGFFIIYLLSHNGVITKEEK